MDSIKKAGLILLIGFAFSKLVGGTIFKFIAVTQLPPVEYGKLALYMILFNWTLLIATFNTTIGLAKFVSEDRSKKEVLYGSVLFGSTIVSLVISGLLVLFSGAISSATALNDAPIILLLAAVLPFSVFYNITVFYFRGLYKMGASTYSEVLLSLLKMVLLVVFFAMGVYYPPYMAFLFAHMLLDLVFIMKKVPSGAFSGGIGRLVSDYKVILMYSLPIFVAEALRTFAMGLDRFFLAGFYTTLETGIYDLGVSFCIGYQIIATSYAQALLPVASKNHRNVSLLKTGLAKTLKYVSIIFAAYSVVLLLVAGPIVQMLNPAYLPLTSFLWLMIVANIMIGFMMVLTNFASAVSMQKYGAISSGVLLAMAIALNFYLIPQLRYIGAIEALLISASVSVALLSVMLWRGLRSRQSR